MSWPDLRIDHMARATTYLPRRRTPLLAVMVVALALSACGSSGFRPLYASGGFGAGVSEQLKQVKVAPIPGRVGQQIRNELIFDTTGGGEALPPTYRLEVAVRENVTTTLVARTADSRTQIYTLDASFRLIDIKSKDVLFSGNSFGRAPFERFDSVFTNVRARRDAENRAAGTIATDLKARLEAFLAGHRA